MRPEYYTEPGGVNRTQLEQSATAIPGQADSEVSALRTTELPLDLENTTSGSYFASLETDRDVRELYAARDVELARLEARRIKLGMFATRKTREEIDREIDATAQLYDRQASLVDQFEVEQWRLQKPDIKQEEIFRNLTVHHDEQERLHDLHVDEAFHQIHRFGVLSSWNDRLSEWYVGLSRRYRIGVAMGATAMGAVAGGATAWSADTVGPTAAFIGGGMLVGAKIYKSYNQARLGIYEEWRKTESSGGVEHEKSSNDGREGKLGRAVLGLVQRSKEQLTGLAKKLSRRKDESGDTNQVGPQDEGDGDAPFKVLPSPEGMHVEAMSRMERRRRERVERADKVNKRARIAVIGAGVLAAVGIGSRFIDFGKITDWFNGRPPVGLPSPIQSPAPTASTTPGVVDGTVGNADGSSLPPPAEEPSPPETPMEQPPPPVLPNYSLAAMTVEEGEGWYQTFSEIGITDATEQANLLNRIGPKLIASGLAYATPDGSYGISRPGLLPREALDLITSAR